MTSLDAFTVFCVFGTIALTVFTLRSHYRAHEGASSRLVTHAVALMIFFVCIDHGACRRSMVAHAIVAKSGGSSAIRGGRYYCHFVEQLVSSCRCR